MDKEMNALIGFIALVVVAIVGWAIAEFKYKAFTFPVLKRIWKRRRNWKRSSARMVSRR